MMRFHRSPERPGSSPVLPPGLPSLATVMAVVMASTGPLPVLAAGRNLATTGSTSAPMTRLDATADLLANQDDSKSKTKDKDAKKKNQQQKNQQQKNQHSGSGSSSHSKDSGHSDQKQNLNKKQRERIYEKGYEDGKDKGLNRGYKKGNEAGYQEGFQKGKDKGLEKGYDKGWDDRKARDKDRWKDWDSNRWRDYNRRNRNIWTKRVVINNNYGAYPGWARRSGWYNNRPWGGNWYGGWSSPPWGWWAGQSIVWGVTALTTAAILNNAINRAITQRQTAIVVPNSNWQLYYGTVQPVQNSGVTFAVNNGYGTYQMEADCEQGLLNGDVPSTAAEAQLINAACQVTYGRGA